MKLLFDENLSPRLVGELGSDWPDSKHVQHLGMRGATDAAIWAHARDADFVIVSKDDDFRSLALVRGPPPKVIWLQIWNTSTAAVADLLRANLLHIYRGTLACILDGLLVRHISVCSYGLAPAARPGNDRRCGLT